MYVIFSIIFYEPSLRNFLDIKQLLHLIPNTRVEYWLVYKDYTKIRVFEEEVTPCQLCVFQMIHVFALEYIRNGISSDLVHLISRKQEVDSKLK